MLVMAWYIAALPATEPTSDRRSRRLGIVSLSFGMAGLVPRDALRRALLRLNR
jgi:hypothetical protein